LRKKLAMRPVISTASGGKTTQKKYRSAFTISSLVTSHSITLLQFVIFDHRIRQQIATKLVQPRFKLAALPFDLNLHVFADSHAPHFRHSQMAHRVAHRVSLRIQHGGFWHNDHPGVHHRHNIAAICGDKRNRRHLLQNHNVENAVPSENIHAYISFVVSRKQKINACVSHSQITNADLRKKLRQERLRKHQPSFRSKHIEPETRLQQKKYSTRGPCLWSTGHWIQCGRFTGPSEKAAKKFRKPM